MYHLRRKILGVISLKSSNLPIQQKHLPYLALEERVTTILLWRFDWVLLIFQLVEDKMDQ